MKDLLILQSSLMTVATLTCFWLACYLCFSKKSRDLFSASLQAYESHISRNSDLFHAPNSCSWNNHKHLSLLEHNNIKGDLTHSQHDEIILEDWLKKKPSDEDNLKSHQVYSCSGPRPPDSELSHNCSINASDFTNRIQHQLSTYVDLETSTQV
ncbi:hypothetical protein Ciccas_010112 [Cichlidogyrus casuarinus]|uniref:Uncharacterized protein n=1 Tax=Cichlidogyrus casuarinus TaxID=1844966 RepID=A0ABD2PW39_9PLAT